MKNKITLIAILLLSTFLSCKKESETEPISTPSNKDLIISSPWKISNYSTNSTDSLTIAFIQSWNEDLKTKPLQVTYSSNGTYNYSDGTNGIWELSGDNKILFDKGTEDEVLSTIDKLTKTEFKVTYTWEISESLKVSVTETAIK